MLSEFWGYLPYLFKEYGTFFQIIKGICDTGNPPPPFQGVRTIDTASRQFIHKYGKMNFSPFLYQGIIEDPNTIINGSMVSGWWADDGPTLNAGVVALGFFRGSDPVLLRNPLFCDFSGGGGGWCLDLLFSPLNPPMTSSDRVNI